MSSANDSEAPKLRPGWLLTALLLAVVATLIAVFTHRWIGSFTELFRGRDDLPVAFTAALTYAGLAPYLSVLAYLPALLLVLKRSEQDSARRWTLVAFFVALGFLVMLIVSSLAMYLPMLAGSGPPG